MAKASLAQYVAALDPLATIDYSLTFSSIPGLAQYDMENVKLNVTQAILPGLTLNKAEQRFAGGTKLNYVVSQTYSGTMAIQIIERVDSQTLRFLRTWQEFARGTMSNNASGYKNAYTTTALLEVYDGPGIVASRNLIYGCFPAEVPELNLDATAESQLALYACTFSYDYYSSSAFDLK